MKIYYLPLLLFATILLTNCSGPDPVLSTPIPAKAIAEVTLSSHPLGVVTGTSLVAPTSSTSSSSSSSAPTMTSATSSSSSSSSSSTSVTAKKAAAEVLARNSKAALKIFTARQQLLKIKELEAMVLSHAAGTDDEPILVADAARLKAVSQIEEAEAILEGIEEETAIIVGIEKNEPILLEGFRILAAEAAIVKEMGIKTRIAAEMALEAATKLKEAKEGKAEEEVQGLGKVMAETMGALAEAQGAGETGEAALKSLE
jgi:hypothetical protein